jgi:hypothetical protein
MLISAQPYPNLLFASAKFHFESQLYSRRKT